VFFGARRLEADERFSSGLMGPVQPWRSRAAAPSMLAFNSG
jgi:hypothetical protein